MKIARGVLSSFCCVAISSLWGRDSKPAPSDSEKAHLRVTVDFKEAEPLRGVSAASIAMIAPMQCTADGTSFVNMLQPPEYKDQELLSISLSGDRRVRAFHIENISDLYDIHKVGYFASSDTVSLLVYASSENKNAKQTVAAQDGSTWQRTANTGEHHYYVVTFDRDGKYKSHAELDTSLQPHTFGVFSSKLMLISGFLNGHSQLALFKSDGIILKYIDLPREYSDTVDSKNATPGQVAGTSTVPEQFIGFQDSIIVVQSGAGLPLLRITEAGTVRTIRTKLPDELVVDTLLVDDTHLYARGIPKGSRDGLSPRIYEINPDDGSVVQEFVFSKKVNSADATACVHEGNFVSFQYGGDGVLVPLIGVPRR